jgi:hypothetical protein
MSNCFHKLSQIVSQVLMSVDKFKQINPNRPKYSKMIQIPQKTFESLLPVFKKTLWYIWTYHVKKPQSSSPSKFSCKKEASWWFTLACTPFSSVFSFVINIIYFLQTNHQSFTYFLSSIFCQKPTMYRHSTRTVPVWFNKK